MQYIIYIGNIRFILEFEALGTAFVTRYIWVWLLHFIILNLSNSSVAFHGVGELTGDQTSLRLQILWDTHKVPQRTCVFKLKKAIHNGSNLSS